jgi:hypothetical protein
MGWGSQNGFSCKDTALAACLMCSIALLNAGAVKAQITPNPQGPSARQVLLLSPYMEYSVKSTLPIFPSSGTIIQPDQQLISFAITPSVTIVTKTASLRRPRAFPESLPAGTPMFQVGVDNGFAYCAFWGAQQGLRETQCFRDINNDGTFDASYLTYNPLIGTTLYVGRIARLASMPPIAYEQQPVETVQEDFTFRFLRIKGGFAEFKPQFGTKRRGFRIVGCDLSSQSGCVLGGHKFFFSQSGTALTISSVERGSGEFTLYSERSE